MSNNFINLNPGFPVLMNPDHFWKPNIWGSETIASSENFLDTDESIFSKFPEINKIIRNDTSFDSKTIAIDAENKNVLFLDDLRCENSNFHFTGKIKNFIRIVAKFGNKRINRKFTFDESVIVTELNTVSQMNYSNCIYNCKKELNLFVFDKPRASITKQNFLIILDEENSKSFVNITHNISVGQKRDDFVEFQHTAPNTYSEINYLALNGGITTSQVNTLLNKNSKKCETYQNIKHILLNQYARSQAKPNLMIQNPDVMAKHGTNIGPIRSEDLMYLEMRGIQRSDGQRIIQDSLMNEAISLHPYSKMINEIMKEIHKET